MTPKETAEELINRYLKVLAGGMYDVREEAKECALIAVDEILSMGIMSESGDWRMAKSYWQEVKQEIKNI